LKGNDVIVSGRVVDELQAPVPDAQVVVMYAYSTGRTSFSYEEIGDKRNRPRCDADGSFSVRAARLTDGIAGRAGHPALLADRSVGRNNMASGTRDITVVLKKRRPSGTLVA